MIAAFLKASDNLAKMCHATVFADDAIFDIENKVHVFWHDDIVLHFNERIVIGNTMKQFIFYHLANDRQFHLRSIGMSVRILQIASNTT